MLPKGFENLFAIVKDDHAVSRISARSPKKIGLVSAQSGGEGVAAAQKIDRARLAVILGEDAAVATLFGRKLVPGLCGFGHDLVPPKLIGVPLRQDRARVRVLHVR